MHVRLRENSCTMCRTLTGGEIVVVDVASCLKLNRAIEGDAAYVTPLLRARVRAFSCCGCCCCCCCLCFCFFFFASLFCAIHARSIFAAKVCESIPLTWQDHKKMPDPFRFSTCTGEERPNPREAFTFPTLAITLAHLENNCTKFCSRCSNSP